VAGSTRKFLANGVIPFNDRLGFNIGSYAHPQKGQVVFGQAFTGFDLPAFGGVNITSAEDLLCIVQYEVHNLASTPR